MVTPNSGAPTANGRRYDQRGSGSDLAFTRMHCTNAALAVNHQGQFPVVTLSFNLAPGASLGDATKAIQQAEKDIHLPASIHAAFQGTAAAFQNSLATEPYLILAAVITVYIVLGVLVRELHPSDHDSFDAAFGGCGRDSGADAYRERSDGGGSDRHHSSDRHCEEERHHDDRLRARGGARRTASRPRKRSIRPACCASVRS